MLCERCHPRPLRSVPDLMAQRCFPESDLATESQQPAIAPGSGTIGSGPWEGFHVERPHVCSSPEQRQHPHSYLLAVWVELRDEKTCCLGQTLDTEGVQTKTQAVRQARPIDASEVQALLAERHNGGDVLDSI